jgi:NhaP-type Na+/H+ or K+/H+ antiporter
VCCFLLWVFWWGLWGLWLVLAAACFLRLLPWGFSAWMLTWRGLGTPRGDVFCGWVSPGGGCLGLCGGGCVAGRVSGGSSRPVSGGRWGDRWAVEVGLGGSLVVFVLLGRRVEWPSRRVNGLALWLVFVGE